MAVTRHKEEMVRDRSWGQWADSITRGQISIPHEGHGVGVGEVSLH